MINSKWNTPAITEAVQRLKLLQLRLERLTREERLRRATAMVKAHIARTENTRGHK